MIPSPKRLWMSPTLLCLSDFSDGTMKHVPISLVTLFLCAHYHIQVPVLTSSCQWHIKQRYFCTTLHLRHGSAKTTLVQAGNPRKRLKKWETPMENMVSGCSAWIRTASTEKICDAERLISFLPLSCGLAEFSLLARESWIGRPFLREWVCMHLTLMDP